MNAISFYNGVIKSLGMSVDDAGYISVPDKEDPSGFRVFTVGKRPLCIPTREWLDENDWTKRIAFHPLCEDIVLGQSPILHFTLRAVKIRLTALVETLAGNMLEIGSDSTLQAEIKNPAAIEVLSCVKDITGTTTKDWKSVKKKFKDTPLLNIYLSQGQELAGVKYQRICTVNCPILDDVDETGVLVGTAVTKTNKRVIIELFKYILGDTLEFGSNETAPYLHSLLTAYSTILARLNHIGGVLSAVNGWKAIDMEWVEGLGYMDRMAVEIPTLPDNAGVLIKAKKTLKSEPETDSFRTLTVKVPEDNPPFEPDTPATKAEPKSTGGISLGQLSKARETGRDRDDDWDYRRERANRYDLLDELEEDRGRRRSGRRDSRDDRYERDRYDRNSRDDRDSRDSGSGRGISLATLRANKSRYR